MSAQAERKKTIRDMPNASLGTQRGSVVKLRKAIKGCAPMAVIVSNDVQNESSSFLLAVPLEKRSARLRAPFAVDFGRKEGLRDLHAARCDWVTRISTKDISRIERASLPKELLVRLDDALRAALDI